MADTMKGLKRTHYCGTVTPEMIGREVVVCGWAQKTRDMGTLVFIDLRDRTGIVQLAFDDKTDPALLAKAQKVRAEYVLMARGVLRQRESVNHEIPTGEADMLFNASHCSIFSVIGAIVAHRIVITNSTSHRDATIPTKYFAFKQIVTFRIFFCFFQIIFMLLRFLFINRLYCFKEFFGYNRLMGSREQRPIPPLGHNVSFLPCA